LIIAVLVVSGLGDDLKRIIISWGVLGIAGYTRLIRSAIISQQALPYVQSAKISGASEFRIMFHHILPNSVKPILVVLFHDIGNRILYLACLSFLRFGAVGVTDWGNQISFNYNLLESRPWGVLWPGIGITITVLGFKLLGDGIQGALDTRKKKMLNSR
jgi:peptide/nickel transport system permease protein